jgi:hypothetical protein
MDDFLRPVKTVRSVKNNIEKFETLTLRESQAKNDIASTRRIISEESNGTDTSSNILKDSEEGDESVDEHRHATEDPTRTEHAQKSKLLGESLQPMDGHISSPEQASAILKEQLTEQKFEAVIRYLEEGIRRKHNFNLHIPSAPAAQILNVLVTTVIPDRWANLSLTTASQVDKANKKSLLLCMSSTAGIGAVLARIQSLLTSPRIRQPGSSYHAVFQETVSFFTSMVQQKTFVRELLFRIESSAGKPGQKQAVWAETTSLFAGSKILNIFLEASTKSELTSIIPSWLQDPRDYSRWLGLSIATAAISIAPSLEEAWRMLANFLKRALSLGHKGMSCFGLSSLCVALIIYRYVGGRDLYAAPARRKSIVDTSSLVV